MEDTQEKQSGFDLVVTKRDDTGMIVSETPYLLRVCGADGGGKTRYWESPKGSGNLFNKKGEPIGRWVKGKFVEGEKHIAFTAPMTEDQKLRQEVIADKAKIADLEKEIAAINAERVKAMAPKPAEVSKKTTGA